MLCMMKIFIVMKSEDDGDTRRGNFTDLGDDTVHEHGGREVVHEVQQAQAAQISPVRKLRHLARCSCVH